jgi:hypothetical protein
MMALSQVGSTIACADPLALMLNPVIWAMVGFVAGVYGFFRGFSLLRRKRFLQDIPRCTIRGAPLGLVEVSGKVEGPYTILAPLSEDDCFYYRAVIWCQQGSAPWHKAAEEVLAAPFFLDDGTGKVLVDPRGAEADLPSTFSDEFASCPPEYLRHFLSRHAIPFEAPVKLEEHCVRPGDSLYVLGTLRENSNEPLFSSASSEREFLSEEATDLQRRGEIEAMLPPGAANLGPNLLREQPRQEFDLHPPVVLAASKDRPLFISSQSEAEIVQTLALRSTMYIWGGPILSLICFWYLLVRLGYQ